MEQASRRAREFQPPAAARLRLPVPRRAAWTIRECETAQEWTQLSARACAARRERPIQQRPSWYVPLPEREPHRHRSLPRRRNRTDRQTPKVVPVFSRRPQPEQLPIRARQVLRRQRALSARWAAWAQQGSEPCRATRSLAVPQRPSVEIRPLPHVGGRSIFCGITMRTFADFRQFLTATAHQLRFRCAGKPNVLTERKVDFPGIVAGWIVTSRLTARQFRVLGVLCTISGRLGKFSLKLRMIPEP